MHIRKIGQPALTNTNDLIKDKGYDDRWLIAWTKMELHSICFTACALELDRVSDDVRQYRPHCIIIIVLAIITCISYASRKTVAYHTFHVVAKIVTGPMTCQNNLSLFNGKYLENTSGADENRSQCTQTASCFEKADILSGNAL